MCISAWLLAREVTLMGCLAPLVYSLLGWLVASVQVYLGCLLLLSASCEWLDGVFALVLLAFRFILVLLESLVLLVPHTGEDCIGFVGFLG